MYKLALSLFFITFSLYSFSQNKTNFSSIDYLKGISYDKITWVKKIDSAGVFIVTNHLKKYNMYYVDVDCKNHSFITKQLLVNPSDIPKTMIFSYLRIENEIFQIRIEKTSKQTAYFNDKFDGEKFMMSSKPFFSKKEKKLDFSMIAGFKAYNNSIIMSSHEEIGDSTLFINTYFDINTFKEISTRSFAICNQSSIKEAFFIDGKNFYLYSNKNNSSKKNLFKLTVLDNGIFKELKFDEEIIDDEKIKLFYVYKMDNMYYLYTIFAINDQCKTAVYKINLENLNCALIEKNIVNVENTNNDTSNSTKRSSSYTYRNYFTLSKVIYDKNDIYLISTYSFFDETVGLIEKELLVTKISDGKVLWSKLFNRGIRFWVDESFSADLIENKLEISDLENEDHFDSDGNWSQEKLKRIQSPTFISIIMIIDKETGNCIRKLVK